MDEFTLLVWGAITGLCSALVLELARNYFSRRQATERDIRELDKKRTVELSDFLRGEAAPFPASPAPYPAWLRQVNTARRYPLARLGLRSDEDYGTDSHATRPDRGEAGKSVTLLKTFRRGNTHARRPSTHKGGKFLLGQSHILGRGSKCDIQVLDPAVSLIHAFIRFEGDHYVLYDLGSTGGTFVNGDPVGVIGFALEGGEIIRMGETDFEFGHTLSGGEPDPADSFLIV